MNADETSRDEPEVMARSKQAQVDDSTDTAPGLGSEAKKEAKKSKSSHRILLVPYPKFIFMYPTMLVALVGAIVLWIGGYHDVAPQEQALPVVVSGLFLVVLLANMFVLVFDFPRATSLTMVFIITTVLLSLWMLTLSKPGFLPYLQNVISAVRPAANATFFLCVAVGMGLMFAAVFVSVRFNYWEVRNNELLHHHGVLSDLKRYPAPNLRVDKEINDLFEYLLLGSGRLILHPASEKRAIVLDNILFVSSKERELTRTLGSIKVQIGGDSGEV
jgi:hypothetical protein